MKCPGYVAASDQSDWEAPWTAPQIANHAESQLLRDRIRPGDGATIRRWTRSTIDLAQQLEHTEDRYEVIRDGEIVASESLSRSPATRGYTQEQAADLFRAARFTAIRLLSGFTAAPAEPDDRIFCALGTRP